MWPRRSHILSLLTRLTPIKGKFKSTNVEQDAFGEIKRIVAHDTLLTYTDFNDTFKINTGISALQLVTFIVQKGKTIDFYSRKLTNPNNCIQ